MKIISAISCLVFGVVLPLSSATLSNSITVNNLAAYTGNCLDYDNGGLAISEAPGNFSDADSLEPCDSVKTHDVLYGCSLQRKRQCWNESF